MAEKQNPYRRAGSPYWYIHFADPDNPGKTRFESTKTIDIKKATKILADRHARVKLAREGKLAFEEQPRRSPSVSAMCDVMLEDMKARGLASYSSTKSALAHIKDDSVGRAKATAITRATLQDYQTRRLASGAAKGTVDLEVSKLLTAFRLAKEDRQVTAVPKVARLLRQDENARQGFINSEDYQTFLDAFTCQDASAFVAWLLTTGQRVSEAARMTWAMLDETTGEIRIPGGLCKNARARVIPLATDRMREIIAMRRAARRLGCDLVFHHDGHLLAKQLRGNANGASAYLSGEFKTAAAAVGRPELTIHDLRRSAVRNLIRTGVAVPIAMAISGHQTVSMFKRYAILDSSAIAEGLRKSEGVSKPLQFLASAQEKSK